jgi:hypothetical protein
LNDDGKQGQDEDGRFYLDLITHDLKNLNQGVYGYLELMEMLPETTDLQKRFLEEALSYVRMSSNLIRSLELEKTGNVVSRPQGLYKVMVESYQSITNVNRNIKLDLDTTGVTRGLKVNGSRLVTDMFTFLLDLMSRRARGGKLKVEATTDPPANGTVTMTLAGDFVPLNDTERANLFESGGGDETKKGKLALCVRIASIFGGKIDYEPPSLRSKWSGGCFKVTLPEVD